MFNFLARVGRQRWSQVVVPLAAGLSASGYIGVHMFGHQIVRNLFIAQSPDETPEQLSPDLRELIRRVYNEIEPVYHIPTLKFPGYEEPKPIISWFCTSLMDPITLGMAESRAGILIGLPSYYNYTKQEDVPSSVFQFRKLSLFRASERQKKNEEMDAEDLIDRDLRPPGQLVSMDPDSPAAKDYSDSLVLSEEAKMFSIARELFMGDSYRPLAKSTIIFGSITLSLQLSRAAVLMLKLKEAHVTQRMSMYGVSAIAGMFFYYFMGDLVERYFIKKADERAISVSSTYRQGARDYFKKLIQRNKALRDLSEDFQTIYDKDGEVREAFTRHRIIPLKERLEYTEEPNDESETKP